MISFKINFINTRNENAAHNTAQNIAQSQKNTNKETIF
jgi:hypothetical protein